MLVRLRDSKPTGKEWLRNLGTQKMDTLCCLMGWAGSLSGLSSHRLLSAQQGTTKTPENGHLSV